VKRCIADDSVGSPHAKVGHRQGLTPKTPRHSAGGFSFGECFVPLPGLVWVISVVPELGRPVCGLEWAVGNTPPIRPCGLDGAVRGADGPTDPYDAGSVAELSRYHLGMWGDAGGLPEISAAPAGR
jgi:hypothetical protein